MLQKLEKVSLVQQVYNQIESMIRKGEWEIGSRIPKEADLMELFGVSRNTLREAVRALVQVGLLDTRQGDGTFVTATSELNAILQKRLQQSTMIEILEVRHAIEREAAMLASLRRTEEQLQLMKQYSELCAQYNKSGHEEQFVKADWSLHRTIVEASGNRLLTDVYTNLFEKVLLTINSTKEMPTMYDFGHRSLVRAIENRDIEAAVGAVDDYIGHVKRKVHSEEI